MPLAARARLASVLALALLALPAVRVWAACSGFGAAANYAAGASPQMLATGDFDGDGITDLAVACLAGAPLAILRGLGNGGFAAPVGWAGGSGARALVVSDFNGDGHPDIALGVSAGVVLWLGDGHGGFVAAAAIQSAAAPGGLAAGDFDSDGHMDLAVASGAASCVQVLRGHGDGTFDPPVTYAAGSSPARLIATDLDGDGILDLAVANNSGASVSVYRGLGAAGLGDGAFAPAITIPVAGSPWGLAALDFDHDGVTDLVVSDGAGTSLALLRGTGGCTFAAAGTVVTPTAPRDLVAGDFDGDGVTDVAAACAAGNVVCVLHGTGSGFTLLGDFTAGAGATGLAGGDWNGDGAVDLASANAGGSSVSRFLGTCPPAPTAAVALLTPQGGETWWPGSAQQVRWSRGAGVSAVDVDLSRDGGASWSPLVRGSLADHYDLLASGAPDPRLRVRVRDALVPARGAASAGDVTLCGLLGAPIVSPLGFVAQSIATGDLDGDGLADVVAADASQVAILRGDGHGHFTTLRVFAVMGTRQLAIADTDGDGIPDLLRLAPEGIGIRRGDGAGGFGPESLLAVGGATAFACGDLDGDGALDLVALAPDGADARLLVWRSSAPGAPWSASLAGAPGRLAMADFDGDGIADLVIGAGSGVQLWYGGGAASRGDGTFVPGPSRSLPSAPGEIAVGDLDGDGALGVLACLPASRDLARLPLTASLDAAMRPGFATTQVASAGGAVLSPLLADLDGDGRVDLVAVVDGSLGAFRGLAGGFVAPTTFAGGTRGPALAIEDFTGDGNPDVVTCASDGTLLCMPAECPPQVAASVALANPADTSIACVGFARSLAWTRSPSVADVRVELSRDGGARWTTLAEHVVTGHWTWIASGPECANARLRVRDGACAARADVTARFAIRAPLGAVTASAAPASPHVLACAGPASGGALEAVLTDGADLVIEQGVAAGFAELARWPEPGVRRALLADLDGDGAADLLTLHADRVLLRRGDGVGGFGAPVTLPLEAGSSDLVVADFDEDGRPDLAVASGDGIANRVSIRRALAPAADGSFGFGPPTYVALTAIPTALAAADLDGDGVLDLVVVHASGVAVLRGGGSAGRGDGTFRLASNRGFGMGDVRALILADFDGDGHLDVAAADSASGALLVAPGDGACGLAAPARFALSGAPLGAALADFDHDGTLDLVASLTGGSLALLRGVAGEPLASRFAPAGELATGGAGGALVLSDVDRDGVADALIADGSGRLLVVRGAMPAAGAPRLGTSPPALVATGSELPLAWTRPAGVASVDVELSRDDGAHWCTIAGGLSGTSWRWNVNGPCTSAARLRVRDASVASAADRASAAFAIDPGVTAVAAAPPDAVRLGSPWPNPGTGAVVLALALPAPAHVRANVRDVGGRRIATIVDASLAAGVHELRWSGVDDAGHNAPPGLYFVHVRAGAFSAIRRLARL
jgi:hypothetical protein